MPFILVSDQTGHFDDMLKVSARTMFAMCYPAMFLMMGAHHCTQVFHPKDGKSTVPTVRPQGILLFPVAYPPPTPPTAWR